MEESPVLTVTVNDASQTTIIGGNSAAAPAPGPDQTKPAAEAAATGKGGK